MSKDTTVQVSKPPTAVTAGAVRKAARLLVMALEKIMVASEWSGVAEMESSIVLCREQRREYTIGIPLTHVERFRILWSGFRLLRPSLVTAVKA